MKLILFTLTVFAFLAGCATGRDSDSGHETEAHKLVETIRHARTSDTDSTEVEDMIIIKVYQLRSEDQKSGPVSNDELESDISNCAVKESAGRLKISSITVLSSVPRPLSSVI